MGYTSITEKEREEMLTSIGVSSLEDLFIDIPASISLKKPLDLPSKLSEIEFTHHIEAIGRKNNDYVSFLGGGAYNHYVPATVDFLSSRSEFYTAYTPYQAEVSQGTLAAIFEYQTMITKLTGMDLSNASMYDGATALAESVFMSLRSNKKKKVLVSKAVHPNYRQVLNTYGWASDTEIIECDFTDGVTTTKDINEKMDDDVNCIIIQNPNFFGSIENVKALADIAHKNKANCITVVTEPVSLGILKNPGQSGADIVCGEGQGFGNYIGFGGPMLGFMSAKSSFVRKMPGRLVGKTVDSEGREAFTLTLQAREQHIRRDRATSNICTNQGLCALRAVIYLSMVGNRLQDMAQLNHTMAGYLRKRLLDIGFTAPFEAPYFNEFVLQYQGIDEKYEAIEQNGYIPGIKLSRYYEEYEDCLLLCATEMNRIEEIDTLISIFEKNL